MACSHRVLPLCPCVCFVFWIVCVFCFFLCIGIRPGDVLFAPSWWWHRVENLAPVNVGSSSRWRVRRAAGKAAEFFNAPALALLWPRAAAALFARMLWDDGGGGAPDGGASSFTPLGASLWRDWILQGSRLEHPEWGAEEALERWVSDSTTLASMEEEEKGVGDDG